MRCKGRVLELIFLYTVDGNVKGYNYIGKQFGSFLKIYIYI